MQKSLFDINVILVFVLHAKHFSAILCTAEMRLFCALWITTLWVFNIHIVLPLVLGAEACYAILFTAETRLFCALWICTLSLPTFAVVPHESRRIILIQSNVSSRKITTTCSSTSPLRKGHLFQNLVILILLSSNGWMKGAA